MTQLDAPASEKWVATDEKYVGAVARDTREDRIDLLPGAGFQDLEFATRPFGLLQQPPRPALSRHSLD
jgi:hypothetical protein